MWVTWCGGDPAGGAGREGGTVNLGGAARVNPVKNVRVLGGPEFLVDFLVYDFAKCFLIFYVTSVRKLGSISSGLFAKVDVVSFLDGVDSPLDLGGDFNYVARLRYACVVVWYEWRGGGACDVRDFPDVIERRVSPASSGSGYKKQVFL